jgi:DNA-binding LytR/AlgR family response regulator
MNNSGNSIIQDRLVYNYGKKAVEFNSIKYIESFAGNYSMIRLNDKGYICSSFTLKHYTSKLEGKCNFFLARKGLLLNLKFIQEIMEDKGVKSVKLSTGEVFKLSRRLGSRLIDYLNES